MTEPVPPRNVRFVYPDGRIVPCELMYRGVEDGTYVWEIVNAVFDGRFDEKWVIEADMIPARTTIRIPVVGRDE